MISLRPTRARLTTLQTTGLFELSVENFDLPTLLYQGNHLIQERLLQTRPDIVRAAILGC